MRVGFFGFQGRRLSKATNFLPTVHYGLFVTVQTFAYTIVNGASFEPSDVCYYATVQRTVHTRDAVRRPCFTVIFVFTTTYDHYATIQFTTVPYTIVVHTVVIHIYATIFIQLFTIQFSFTTFVLGYIQCVTTRVCGLDVVLLLCYNVAL